VIKNVICGSESDLNRLMITVKRKLSVIFVLIRDTTRFSVHCITVTAAEMMMLSNTLRHLNFNIISLLSAMLKQSSILNSIYHC